MNKYLLVYNICGLSKDNTKEYIQRLDNILFDPAVVYKYMDVVISSCFNSEECRKTLKVLYPNIPIVTIDEKQCVGVTFNKTCQVLSKYRNYDGYIYCASDIDIKSEPILYAMYLKMLNPNNGLVAAQVNRDSGADYWLEGIQYPSEIDFKIPVGKTLSLHLQGFSKEIYTAYGNRLIPDCFTSYCCESSFQSMCAALKKDFLVIGKYVADHAVSLDGNCRVFGGHQDATYPGTQSMKQIIDKAKAENIQLFYQSIFGPNSKWGERLHHIPNPINLDENGYARGAENEKLYNFIRDNLFLSKNILDYDKIPYNIL